MTTVTVTVVPGVIFQFEWTTQKIIKNERLPCVAGKKWSGGEEKRLRKGEGKAKSYSAQSGANPATTIQTTHPRLGSFCGCFLWLCSSWSPSLCQHHGGKGETGGISPLLDALWLPRTIHGPHGGENMQEQMQCAVLTVPLCTPFSALNPPCHR